MPAAATVADMCRVAADYQKPEVKALQAQMRALRGVAIDTSLTRGGIATPPTAAQRAQSEGRKTKPQFKPLVLKSPTFVVCARCQHSVPAQDIDGEVCRYCREGA